MIIPAHLSKCYFFEKENISIVLALTLPKEIRMNDEGFHNTSDKLGALIYENDYPYNFINNREVEQELVDAYHDKTMTFEWFNSLKNEEDKAAIVTLIKENEGEQGLLNFLGAVLVDEHTFNHPEEDVYDIVFENGRNKVVKTGEKRPGYVDIHRLYRTKKNFEWASDKDLNRNVPLAWQEMSCASTGQTYLISVCPTIKTAEEGAKYLRPSVVPQTIPYVWQSAN
jgi:hypothetical protein